MGHDRREFSGDSDVQSDGCDVQLERDGTYEQRFDGVAQLYRSVLLFSNSLRFDC